MRHNVKGRKLQRTASHRRSLLNGLSQYLVMHKSLKTTDQKAKELQRTFDKLVTYGKKNNIPARREAFKILKNRTLVKELFDVIAPSLADRTGGYTRIDKLYYRCGDGALISNIQIIGFNKYVKSSEEENMPDTEEVIKDKEEIVQKTT